MERYARNWPGGLTSGTKRSNMKDKERILDSGEIYKDPEEEKSIFPLEFLKDKVDWSSVKTGKSAVPGGNPEKSHNLIPVGKEVVRFVPTFFYAARKTHFLILAPFVFAGSIYLFNEALIKSYGLLIFALGLFLAAFLLFYYGYLSLKDFSTQILFDKKRGIFSHGIFKKEEVQLEEIKAVQLINEFIPANQGSNKFAFDSFEINLVLISGERINVVDHSAKRAAHRQATRLAVFLDVPLLILKDSDK